MAAKRILIVEDEGIIAKDIERALAKLAYEVIAVVSTGEQAILLAGTARPDLVLMDIMLKGDIDGIEAAQRIRREYGTPVVYLSGYGDSTTLQRATETAPFGYVLKPFDDRDLYAAVESALYKNQMERDLRSCRQELVSILAVVFDGIIVSDRDGLIAIINSAASHLTEWGCEDAVGRDWSDVFKATEPLPSDLAPFGRRADAFVETSADGVSFAVLLSQTGRRIPVEHRSAPITDSYGDVSGTVLAFRALRPVPSIG